MSLQMTIDKKGIYSQILVPIQILILMTFTCSMHIKVEVSLGYVVGLTMICRLKTCDHDDPCSKNLQNFCSKTVAY